MICNYADGNTMYACNIYLNTILRDLSDDFETLSEWFYEKYMVLNPNKYHILTLGLSDTKM